MARSAQTPIYYRPVPGSRELSTSATDSETRLKKLENAAGGEAMEIEYAGETLRRGPAMAFPTDLYDKVMPGLDALEQAVLGHLYRLSIGAGADWVRTGKKELVRRTGLSSRRLLKALSGLAGKGIIRPLHRDTNGTLYKMHTVDKMYPVIAPKPGPEKPKPTEKIAPLREKSLESPINEEIFPGDRKVLTMREIAAEFFKRAGQRPSDADMDAALAQITYLLEDGYSRAEVRDTALFLVQTFGKSASISKLPYYIHHVIGA